jgi:hypothetical protein
MLYLSFGKLKAGMMRIPPYRFCVSDRKTNNRSADVFAFDFCCKILSLIDYKAIVAQEPAPSRLP